MRLRKAAFQFSGSQKSGAGGSTGAKKGIGYSGSQTSGAAPARTKKRSFSSGRPKRKSLPPTTNARARHAAKMEDRNKRRKNRGGMMAGIFQSMRGGRGQQQGAQGPVSRVAARGRNPMRGAPRRPQRKSPGMTGYQRFTKPYGRGGHGRR